MLEYGLNMVINYISLSAKNGVKHYDYETNNVVSDSYVYRNDVKGKKLWVLQM